MFMAQFTFIDLFCGLGGFRLALESVGGMCVFSSDIDPYARATYKANFGEEPSGDITKIDSCEIPPFNVLCAGFPCQAFSCAGKQRGFSDKRGTLFFQILRIAAYHRPEVLFLENVENLIRHDGGRTLQVILYSLQAFGYKVYHKVLIANDYGVAQIRKRIYFVCIREDLKISFNFPKPFGNATAVEDYLEESVNEKYFITDPSIYFYKPDLEHRINTTCRIGGIGKLSQSYRIYSSKGVTPTFVCQNRGPGGGTEAYLIDGRVRSLTPTEAKRIMGFPESYIFPVSDGKALELLGNSVAIPVIRAIAQEIVATGLFDSFNPEF